MNRQQVVDTIAMQLAERRRQARARHAAYRSLALAIVSGPSEESTLFSVDPLPTSLEDNGVAAAA
jgi:hypothetical protein